jgi:lipid-A-disaccharide synthase
LAKALIKIPHIGMVNVVAGKQIVPECVQYQATGSHIAQALRSIFTNELRVCEIRDELKKIKNTLGSHHAAETAAEKILTFLD